MKQLFLLIILGLQINVYAQDKSATTNVNDKNYTRIIDGVVSSEKYGEPKYEVKLLTEKEEVKLKLHYDKHVMLINTQNYPIEDYIFVQHRDKYLNPNLPKYIKLPIVIDGKLLSMADRKKMLPSMDGKKAKRIVFVNRASAGNKYTNAPFGVIELFY